MAIFKKREKWFIDYRADGRRYRECVGTSHALAKQALSKRLSEIAEGKFFPGRAANAQSFNDFADKWWKQHGQTLRSKSWGLMLKQIKTAFGPKRMGSISTGDIQTYYNGVAANSSTSTANRHFTLLRSIFNCADAWGDFHGDNPCTRVKRGREAAHRLRYLTQDEIKAVLEAAHPRLYPALACAILTGMRRAEVLGLRWENLSLESDTIYLLQTKSGKPREVPIGGKLHEVLLSLGPKPNGPVFELPVIMLRRYFDRALKQAGIFSFRWHDLRHTFASWFMMRGGNIYTLQKLLGHSSIAMTERYSHLASGHLKSEMALFESAIPVKAKTPILEPGWTPNGHQALVSPRLS